MAKTVVQGFEKLLDTLLITDLQEGTVSTRHRNVRDAVKKRLVVLDDFLIGSYRRNTMIAPLKEADIDVFVVLDSQYYREDGQSYILNKVRDVLIETYPSTPKISRDGQAVTITFSDFQVDVVPAFKLEYGPYRIANTIVKRWVLTDPQKHITIWSAANKAHNYELVPLIKMIKAWNRVNGSPLTSFHLECLILQILQNTAAISDSPSIITYVFRQAYTYIKYSVSVPDPAGYSSNVDEYLSTQVKRDEVVSCLETAYYRAKKAEELATKGNVQEAYTYWGYIFGDYFPAFG